MNQSDPNPNHATKSQRIHRRASQSLSGAHTPRRGIRFLAILYSVGFTLAYGGELIFQDSRQDMLEFPKFLFALISIACALIVLALSYWKRMGDELLSWLVHGWILLAILGIYSTENWYNMLVLTVGVESHHMGISWACVLLALFPILVQSDLKRTILTGLIGATLGPIYLLLLGSSVHTLADPSQLIGFSLPLYICAAISMIPSIVLARHRRDLERAMLLGAYKLEKKIGQGGMGEVWRAEHQMLATPAAIKLIRPESFGTSLSISNTAHSALRRFQREAQATASLESPHTIQVYDFGVTEEQSFYYVMELLNGLDAQSLVNRFGPVSPNRAISILEQACHSLEEAHEQGLIHRDIKPSNIFICRRGLDCDYVKVLDFGLVKSFSSAKKETRLTMDGTVTGTPSCMAPEVAMGRNDLDQRIDLYALGCVAYWLITAHDVFESESSVGMMVQHVHDEPEPPSSRTRQPIPKDFEELILRCLAKDPEERPQTATEFREALVNCSSCESWTQDEARQWWEDNGLDKTPEAGESEEPISVTDPTLVAD